MTGFSSASGQCADGRPYVVTADVAPDSFPRLVGALTPGFAGVISDGCVFLNWQQVAAAGEEGELGPSTQPKLRQVPLIKLGGWLAYKVFGVRLEFTYVPIRELWQLRVIFPQGEEHTAVYDILEKHVIPGSLTPEVTTAVVPSTSSWLARLPPCTAA